MRSVSQIKKKNILQKNIFFSFISEFFKLWRFFSLSFIQCKNSPEKKKKNPENVSFIQFHSVKRKFSPEGKKNHLHMKN